MNGWIVLNLYTNNEIIRDLSLRSVLESCQMINA